MAKDTAPAGATNANGGKAAPEKPSYHACKCMHGTRQKCTEQTTKAFARGHDARMSSRLAGLVATGKMELAKAKELIVAAGGSELLVGKMERSAQLRIDRASQPNTVPTRSSKSKAKDKAAAPPPEDEDGLEDTPGAAADDLEEPDDDLEEDGVVAPEVKVGDQVQVKHGNLAYKAVVVRNAANDLVARHRLKGSNCDHPIEN